jgi:hypothetical protein
MEEIGYIAFEAGTPSTLCVQWTCYWPLSKTHKNTMLNIQGNTCHNPKQHKESRGIVEISIMA